jgi:hypothetical protein
LVSKKGRYFTKYGSKVGLILSIFGIILGSLYLAELWIKME